MRMMIALVVLASVSMADTIYSTGFESGSLGNEWSTYSSDSGGRIELSSTLGATTHAGTYHLTMDRTPSGALNLNEAILTLDLSSYSSAHLQFWHKDVGDEDLALSSSFVGHQNGDGVSISADGSTWHRLVSLNSPNNVYTSFDFDLGAAASSAGISLGAGFQIKFQQYDNFPFNSDGRTFDDLLVTTEPIPEPGTFVLFGVAAAGAYVIRRRRKAS